MGKDKFYINISHNFEVITKQEIQLNILEIDNIKQSDGSFVCNYTQLNSIIDSQISIF
jgi:hypothetical protein